VGLGDATCDCQSECLLAHLANGQSGVRAAIYTGAGPVRVREAPRDEREAPRADTHILLRALGARVVAPAGRAPVAVGPAAGHGEPASGLACVGGRLPSELLLAGLHMNASPASAAAGADTAASRATPMIPSRELGAPFRACCQQASTGVAPTGGVDAGCCHVCS